VAVDRILHPPVDTAVTADGEAAADSPEEEPVTAG
jgi:hypothetical protein